MEVALNIAAAFRPQQGANADLVVLLTAALLSARPRSWQGTATWNDSEVEYILKYLRNLQPRAKISNVFGKGVGVVTGTLCAIVWPESRQMGNLLHL